MGIGEDGRREDGDSAARTSSATRAGTRKSRSKTAAKQRSANAKEMSPETLIPEVVKTNLQRTPPNEESRHTRIAKRAHELAKRRGFAPGGELQDWLQAEREIDSEAGPQTRPENQFTG